MLPAAHRMRAAADFTETTRRGAKAARGCVVVYVQHGSTGTARAGLIVGKVVGGSVQRHRAARRIRGVLADVVPGLPDGTRVVVRALAGADVDPGLDSAVRSGVEAASRRGARSS